MKKHEEYEKEELYDLPIKNINRLKKADREWKKQKNTKKPYAKPPKEDEE